MRAPVAKGLPRASIVIGAVLIVILAILAGGRLAYPAMFSTVQPYDDEGYLLISFDGYLAGEPLYGEVYSQYGPFFYVALAPLLRFLGPEVSHDGGRLLTLGIWLLTAALLAVAVLLQTRHIILGLGTFLLSVVALTTLSNEPMHPGGLLVLLLAMVVVAMAIEPGRPSPAGYLVIGAAVGAALLTKANVGAFALVAAGFSLVWALPKATRWLRFAAAAAFVAAPSLLMWRDLSEDWARTYAAVVSLSALALVITATTGRKEADMRWRHIGWALAGAGGVAAVTIVATLARGTTLGQLVRGTVLDPLNHPRAFALPFSMPIGAVWLGVAGCTAAISRALLHSTRLSVAGRAPLVPAIARIVAGLVIWTSVSGTGRFALSPLGLALPLAWVAAIPGPEPNTAPTRSFQRLFLPALAILQSLHAYPVGGSQISWSGLLFIPVGAICLSDGWRQLAVQLGAVGPVLRLVGRGAVGLVVIAFLAWFSLGTALPLTRLAEGAYRSGRATTLTGASRIRMQPAQADTYEGVTAWIRARCTTFVSMPGLNSFYLFAEQDPPTWLNATGWAFLLGPEAQQRVVEHVEGLKNVCALRNDSIQAFWSQGRPTPPGPLVRYIQGRFRSETNVDGYEILRRVE